MSITEAAAIKAVEDGLAGRNVPIVHEEIRVVLAMALRAETAERDLDTARGLIARLGDADALESLNALLTLERANHLSARARVVELERERDEAADEAAACIEFLRTLRDWHSFWEEGFLGEKTASASRQNGQALRAFLDETGHARRVVERLASLERDLAEARLRVCTTAIGCGECERCRAVASAARLRDALGKYGDHAPCCDYAERALYEDCACGFRDALASAPSAEPEGPDYSGLCSAPECGGHCGYTHAVGCEAIREYLAEHGGAPYKAPARTAHLAPSAEPTPHEAYMRVAEAVREACADCCDHDEGSTMRLRDLDLAAVVAKALEVVP